MNRKLVLLNLALLALAAALVWTLRANWLNARAKESAVLARQVPPKKLLPPPAPAPVKPVSAGEYLDVAGKMLFSKDRNPTVVIEAPPVKPEAPMPPLPRYYGQMAIGDPVALLALPPGGQRGYRAGETIGDFTLVSFDRDNIAFEWHGKQIERKVEDLRPKEEAVNVVPQQGVLRPGTPPAAPTPNTTSSVGMLNPDSRTKSLGGSSSSASGKPDDTSSDAAMGPLQPDGSHTCVPTDTSPSGTVKSGFIKTVTPTVVGILCNWEQLK